MEGDGIDLPVVRQGHGRVSIELQHDRIAIVGQEPAKRWPGFGAFDGEPEVVDAVTGHPMPRPATLRGAMNELRPDILTSVDPPRHTFLRKVASAAFTPKAITRLGAFASRER